jgi:transposase
MAKYKSTDAAGIFITVDLQEQILPETFEWAVNYCINKADLSSFDALYKNDEAGAAAYPPKTLLKVILFCYAHGILSSRKIEVQCRVNMVCKALAEDLEMKHSVISDFVSSSSEQIKALFIEVLMQCYELGLIGGELFAIDGCKLSGNAAKEWSNTIEGFQKKKASWEKLLEKIFDLFNNLSKLKSKQVIKQVM